MVVVSEQERCNALTPTGEKCNMLKGHSANFHRHREYKIPTKWIIKDLDSNVLEEGDGRKELGYALTRWLNNGSPIVIEINP